MSNTPNLNISHIDANQNQKEVTANTAFDDLDTAMTDYFAETLSGAGDFTASSTSLLSAFIDLVGATSAGLNYVLPVNKRFYTVRHLATGGHAVTLKTAAAGTNGTVVIQSGDMVTVYNDGTNIVLVGVAQRPVKAITATATLLPVCGNQKVFVDGTAAAFALTLPDATLVSGAEIEIVTVDNSGNLVTPTGASSQNINGANTYTGLTAQYKYLRIVSNGTHWWIVGSN